MNDCTVVERCQAGGQGPVLASTRPRAHTGQQKVQLSSKTEHFAHLGMTNLGLQPKTVESMHAPQYATVIKNELVQRFIVIA